MAILSHQLTPKVGSSSIKFKTNTHFLKTCEPNPYHILSKCDGKQGRGSKECHATGQRKQECHATEPCHKCMRHSPWIPLVPDMSSVNWIQIQAFRFHCFHLP